MTRSDMVLNVKSEVRPIISLSNGLKNSLLSPMAKALMSLSENS